MKRLKRLCVRCFWTLLLSGSIACWAQSPARKETSHPIDPDPWKGTDVYSRNAAPPKEDPTLPRVLIVGDSISQNYRDPMRAALQGQANVWRIPQNGGSTQFGLTQLNVWLKSLKWDVILFNWGNHDYIDTDPAVTVDEYEKNLRELVRRLKATQAHLIWVSTTPCDYKRVKVRKGSDGRPIYLEQYNEAARKIMGVNGIEIIDLYAVIKPLFPKVIGADGLHYKPEGYALMADQIAKRIQIVLGKRKGSARSEHSSNRCRTPTSTTPLPINGVSLWITSNFCEVSKHTGRPRSS